DRRPQRPAPAALERFVRAVSATLLVIAALLVVALAAAEPGALASAPLLLFALALGGFATLRLLPPFVHALSALRRRLAVRRARRAFRDALAAADRHPELVDLVALRAAADRLRTLHAGLALSSPIPEILAALDHPYGPIRDAARRIIEAPGASTSRTPSGS
ncbi:MAG: hypothetical protein D6776_09615, partial [Planctomycetota bacterium]